MNASMDHTLSFHRSAAGFEALVMYQAERQEAFRRLLLWVRIIIVFGIGAVTTAAAGRTSDAIIYCAGVLFV